MARQFTHSDGKSGRHRRAAPISGSAHALKAIRHRRHPSPTSNSSARTGFRTTTCIVRESHVTLWVVSDAARANRRLG